MISKEVPLAYLQERQLAQQLEQQLWAEYTRLVDELREDGLQTTLDTFYTKLGEIVAAHSNWLATHEMLLRLLERGES